MKTNFSTKQSVVEMAVFKEAERKRKVFLQPGGWSKIFLRLPKSVGGPPLSRPLWQETVLVSGFLLLFVETFVSCICYSVISSGFREPVGLFGFSGDSVGISNSVPTH